MLEAMDYEMGRLLDALPKDVRENMTVIFVGDNGTPPQAAQEPFQRRRAKGTVFEGGIHVPMVVAGAGVTRKGEREPALINTVDLFATVADLAGADGERINDAVSFKSLLSGTQGPRREFAYAEFFGSARF